MPDRVIRASLYSSRRAPTPFIFFSAFRAALRAAGRPAAFPSAPVSSAARAPLPPRRRLRARRRPVIGTSRRALAGVRS